MHFCVNKMRQSGGGRALQSLCCEIASRQNQCVEVHIVVDYRAHVAFYCHEPFENQCQLVILIGIL